MIKTRIVNSEIQALDQEKLVGKLEFSLKGNELSILHTYAYESGRGIGSLLVETAMKWAEINHYTILPICSFAQKYISPQNNTK